MQKDDGFDKDNFRKYVDYLPEKVRSKNQKYNIINTIDVPFNRQDPNLTFYRESIQIQIKTELLTKFGWKIANLEKQNEDLIMQCCSLLQSQLLYPVTIITNIIEPSQPTQPDSIKCLWMETLMHRGADSKEIQSLNSNKQLFNFYEKKLLPLIVSFIKKYLDWKIIVNSTHDHQTILNFFESEVIAKANELIFAVNKEKEK